MISLCEGGKNVKGGRRIGFKPPSCTTDNVIILLFDLKYQYFQVYSILNHFKHERSVEFMRPNFTVNIIIFKL